MKAFPFLNVMFASFVSGLSLIEDTLQDIFSFVNVGLKNLPTANPALKTAINAVANVTMFSIVKCPFLYKFICNKIITKGHFRVKKRSKKMRIIINGILKEFPQIKDEKPKVKVEKLNLSKLNKSSYLK